MSSMFDPSAFLDATTTESSVRRDPLPVGEYLAVIGPELSIRNGDKDSKPWYAIDLTLEIQIPSEVQAAMGLDSSVLKIRDGMLLDISASGGIDYGKGKNTRLRMYREATDLNTAGTPFSPRMLSGRQVKVMVKHEEYNGNLQEKIAGIAHA